VNPLERRVPSQDDIDRSCKVANDAPISTSQGASTKIFDSIKEIERNRKLLLAQQGRKTVYYLNLQSVSEIQLLKLTKLVLSNHFILERSNQNSCFAKVDKNTLKTSIATPQWFLKPIFLPLGFG